MRHAPIDPKLFVENRERLARLMLPNSLAVLNANDILPTNADGSMLIKPNSDLFHLTGIEQEESILVLYPQADDEAHRAILFLREAKPELELWEGHKLSKEEARKISGVQSVHWLQDFPRLFHRLACECDHIYLNTNEHKRAVVEVETRDARFITDIQRRYPLHSYQRLAKLTHRIRAEKSPVEIELMRKAADITRLGFERVARFVKPGVNECEIEAEFIHEFVRNRATFAYNPIIATGKNALVLHYVQNDQPCKKGDLLLLDVAACYGNYNADLTRTIPVTGKFTGRQKQVYNAVLRVLRACIKGLAPGRKVRDWQKEAEQLVEKELVDLGLLTLKEIKRQNPASPALKKYFMHGVGHPLGLDVHDVGLTVEPMDAGWVMTVEPAIYIPEENLAVRLENDVVITENGVIDLMDGTPLEVDEIEDLMKRR